MLERFSSDQCSSIFPFECVRQADGHQQVVLYQHIHHRKQAVAVYLNESAMKKIYCPVHVYSAGSVKSKPSISNSGRVKV